MKWVIILFLTVALFVRFYRLDESSHFAFDESRDLVNMHQIWVEKKITLVGPISEDRSHANSSLMYYMLLPFAVMFNFDPIGPVIGSVFWGILTSGLMYLVLTRYNQNLKVQAAILAALWVPLVVTSRWAWNPNNLIFWIFLAIWFQDSTKWFLKLGAGICMGLAFHHHNLAIIPIVLWLVHKRDLKLLTGVLISFLPFVIFDLRHPPGIFISRMIDYNRDTVGQNPLFVLKKIPATFKYYFDYLFQNQIITWIGMILTLALAMWDAYKRNSARIWLVIWIGCLLPLALFKNNYHYFLPGVPFFIIWVFIQREQAGKTVSNILLLLLSIGSIFSISQVWHAADWEGNLKIVRGGTKIISEQVRKQNLVNSNLAVLGSPDVYTNGNKYRNMLLVENIRLKSYDEFSISDNLFVVTNSGEEVLRKDPAAEIMYFRNGPVYGKWEIGNTGWRVIQFNKY